jgi:hypothetical protein
MKTLVWLLPLYAVALIPLSAAGGLYFRGGDEDDGLKRKLKKSKKETDWAPPPPYYPPPPPLYYPPPPSPPLYYPPPQTCIWPGVTCTTDVVQIQLNGANLGTTIPTEIGLLSYLGELSF